MQSSFRVTIHNQTLTITPEITGVSIGIAGYENNDGGDVVFIETFGDNIVDPAVYIWNDINNGEPVKVSLAKARYQNNNNILKFNCPSCNKARTLEVVMSDAVVTQTIIPSTYGVEFNDDHVVSDGTPRYQCVVCGYVIQDGDENVSNEEDLIEWLQEQK